MKSIQHLSADEQKHFILCECGEYLDMRNLSDVFKHLHNKNIPQPQWSHSKKTDEPAAYSKSGRRIDLN